MTKAQFTELIKQLDFKPSYTHLFRHLLLDGTMVGVCLLLAQFENLGTWLMSQFIVAIFMFRMFALMHDAVHGAISRQKTINNFIGLIAGVLCFLPFLSWKKVHIEHHHWAGNIEKDPVMRIVNDFALHPEKNRTIINVAWRYWLPILTLLQHLVFWTSAISAIKNCKGKEEWIYVSLSYLLPTTLYIWLAPSLISYIPGIILYFCMTEVINLPHHLQLPQFRGAKKLVTYEQFQIARSCHYPFFFSYFLLNNFNYHTEHHMLPSLPWYRLHSIRPKMKELLGKHYNESFRSSWIFENRKKNIKEVIVYDSRSDQNNKSA